ncbi:hypothetical protein IE81DRAFT_167122 [Ceraceosorus guamensis]|uniref:Large ribosomal subunit protein mL59 domain-containing protein n=1 Tax=Ceraceosorus guamensis TaxID=1522189 RepID=A0A316W785_9BASI|nr:hypothetical protein IE81DRAFT_167122 [Ceraceosorus guamensis]PWN45727.1 hypothetical protein IE81DRAFT_167122 [Ceraceosorus guamensis]
MSALRATRCLRAATPVSLVGLEGESLSAARTWNRFAQRQLSGPREGSDPFQPVKNAETEAWWPPLYSGRRQKKIALAALSLGKLDELPRGTKVDKLRDSLSNVDLARDSAPPASLLASEITITQEELEAASTSETSATSTSEKGSKKESTETLRQHALAHAQGLGPYKGRSLKKLFKGRQADKLGAQRKLDVQAKMANMDKNIEEWKEGLQEAKQKKRSKVPF